MKIALHANSGGNIEVMGLLTGRCIEENGRGTFLVVDVFPLPVEGTETRVNAQSEANEYMIDYLETLKKSGRKENVVGWYHSHPGYGCWLSGIDVSTQMTNQKYQDPFVAVVVDPFDSIAMGKVSIGSFRTYPDDYIGKKEFHATQMIPVEKIEDFGVHAKQYYEIESKFCRTSIDNSVLGLLKGQYWASILNARTLSKSESILVKETEELSKRLKSNSRSLSSSDIKDESKRASTNLQDNTLGNANIMCVDWRFYIHLGSMSRVILLLWIN